MEKIDWESVQSNSDIILSDGLYKLKTAPIVSSKDIKERHACNYFISCKTGVRYTGEGEDAYARIKQQFNPAVSTFYRSYQQIQQKSITPEILGINDFSIQLIQTHIGRKELEEFAIANSAGLLNKFQLNKRSKHEIACQNSVWDRVQNDWENLLKQAELEIFKSDFNPWFANAVPALAGIYIVKDTKNDIIYIGESSLLNKRYKVHSERTYFSSLRRHIGTEILGYQLQTLKGKKRYFTPNEDLMVTEFLRECRATLFPVTFGRFELEVYLIKKHRPLLNRKSNLPSI